MNTPDWRELYSRLCKTANTPVALGCYLRLKYDESQLADVSINPSNYIEADSFAVDYQVTTLLKKWPDLKTGIDTESIALKAFLEGERRLFLVNRNLQRLDGLSMSQLNFISKIQRKIQKLLGPFSLFKVDDFGWGPGVTSTLKGRSATLVHKIREDQLSVTSDALDLAMNIVGLDIHWARARGIPADGPCSLLADEFKVVRGSRLLTVPKDATKDRVIAAEPTINIFLQKGVGRYIRSRLKLVGVNLDDQSRNQNLASLALSKSLATIDLENASNSVSTSLVELLLPSEWYEHLDSIRCKYTTLGGRTLKLEMFSSMGNGFTFELESLIFWAVSSLISDTVGIYGDDIIVDQVCADQVIDTLGMLGFKTNVKKTFTSGCFFESCGKHYFRGIDVTPLFWRAPEPDDPTDQRWLSHRRLNSIYRRVKTIDSQYESAILQNLRWCLHRLWLHAIRSVEIRYVIPEWYTADDGYIVPNVWQRALKTGKYGAIKLRILKPVGRAIYRSDRPWQESLLAYALRFLPETSFQKDGLGIRGSPRLIERKIWFGSPYSP